MNTLDGEADFCFLKEDHFTYAVLQFDGSNIDCTMEINNFWVDIVEELEREGLEHCKLD